MPTTRASIVRALVGREPHQRLRRRPDRTSGPALLDRLRDDRPGRAARERLGEEPVTVRPVAHQRDEQRARRRVPRSPSTTERTSTSTPTSDPSTALATCRDGAASRATLPHGLELLAHDDAVVERDRPAVELLLGLVALAGDDHDVAGPRLLQGEPDRRTAVRLDDVAAAAGGGPARPPR